MKAIAYVDYRSFDSVTKFDCLMKRPDEALDAFACATVLSSLDLAMAYHQVFVKLADVQKNRIHHACWPVRDSENCFKPLQCAVEISAPDNQRFAGPNWQKLSRVFRRCYRLLLAQSTARERLASRA